MKQTNFHYIILPNMTGVTKTNPSKREKRNTSLSSFRVPKQKQLQHLDYNSTPTAFEITRILQNYLLNHGFL